jgi:hypothetical protein
VEQEAEADDVSVLDHVLRCDVERERLLKEQAEIYAIEEKTKEEKD